MDSAGLFTLQHSFVQEYLSIPRSSERLTWLVERPPHMPLLAVERCIEENRIHGCIAGLWIEASLTGGQCSYRCRSQSQVIQGIATFLCDLFSGKSPREVLSIDGMAVASFELESLVTISRHHAVSRILAKIYSHATQHLSDDIPKAV